MTNERTDEWPSDGRSIRRRRNRDRVVDAFLDLVREGDPAPSFDRIAARARVSARSIYRYFPLLDDLLAAACAQVTVAFTEPCRVEPGADLDERIERFVSHRLDLYEATAPIARAARSSYANSTPVIQVMVEIGLAVRAQIDTVFAGELQRVSTEDQVSARVALYMPFVYDSLEMAYTAMDRLGVERVLRAHLERFFQTVPTR